MVRNRKTKFLSKNGKNWSSRYAMEKLRFLRGTRCLKISEISPDFSAPKTPPPPSKFSPSNTSNLCFEVSGTLRSHPGTFIRVQIIFLPAELLQISVTCDIISGDERWGCDRVVSEPQNSVYTAMAGQGERYIYQRFPYVIVDDTPSSSSGSDSDPSEAVSSASHAYTVPPIPPLPEPVPVPSSPPVPPIIPSPPHSPSADPVTDRRQSISPPRVPVWDGLWRMRGQARKTTGLPPRHQMAPREEPQTVHEVGESSHQAELRAQDTRNTVLEILTSHLTLAEQVNVLGADTQAWRAMIEERLRRTWRQTLVVIFWQEVALWSERWVYLRQLVSTMSLEARLMMIAIVMAAIAIVISCLPFFIRTYQCENLWKNCRSS
ncbi:hypothetical protein E3N88_31632 [Mikania micrantha]|uniref:Uncharacterized protein n=1 Tax=Mikania micrantha TaxID=192012 RepID=A0A5N6M6X8_9ASTR|nr:hypothetical protein E3N88_31632 [Mikania micrantha]